MRRKFICAVAIVLPLVVSSISTTRCLPLAVPPVAYSRPSTVCDAIDKGKEALRKGSTGIRVFYIPFGFRQSDPYVPGEVPESVQKPVVFSAPLQAQQVQSLLLDNERGMLSRKHPKIKQFGRVCLHVENEDSSSSVLVDQKGILKDGQVLCKLPKHDLLQLQQILNDAWYAQHMELHKYFTRQELDASFSR